MTLNPPNSFQFVIDMVGTETGKTYKGKFLYVRPTVGKRRDIDQIESMLNAEYQQKYKVETLTKSVKNYNYTVAYLRVCLEECPDWFTESNYGLNLQDENILDLIAYKIRTFEEDRIKQVEDILSKPRQKIETKEEDVQ